MFLLAQSVFAKYARPVLGAGLVFILFSCTEDLPTYKLKSKPCIENSECGVDGICLKSKGMCMPKGYCDDVYDCDFPLICENGRCIEIYQRCMSKKDCQAIFLPGAPEGVSCIPATHTCGPVFCWYFRDCSEDEYCNWDTRKCESNCYQTGCRDGLWCDPYSKECIIPDPYDSCAHVPRSLKEAFGKSLAVDITTRRGYRGRIYIDNLDQDAPPHYDIQVVPWNRRHGGTLTMFERSKDPGFAHFEVRDRLGLVISGDVPFDWSAQQPLDVGNKVVVDLYLIDDYYEPAGVMLTLLSPSYFPLYRAGYGAVAQVDPSPENLLPYPYYYDFKEIGCTPRRKDIGYQTVVATVIKSHEDSFEPVVIKPDETKEVHMGGTPFLVHNAGAWNTSFDNTSPSDRLSCGPPMSTGFTPLYYSIGGHECERSKDCPETRPACILGKCSPSCTETGCPDYAECDEKTGLCDLGACRKTITNEFTNELCSMPLGYCNETTGRCVRSCLDVGCPQGDEWCDEKTGMCMDPNVDPVCYSGGSGPAVSYIPPLFYNDFCGININETPEDSCDCVVSGIKYSDRNEQLQEADLHCMVDGGHDDAILGLPVPRGEKLEISKGDTVTIHYANARGLNMRDFKSRKSRFYSAAIERDGMLVYASMVKFEDGWLLDVPGLAVESRSFGCPKIATYSSYQEVQMLHFEADGLELDLKPNESDNIYINGEKYSVINVDSRVQAGDALANESEKFAEDEMSQYIIVHQGEP
ncbi:MAG: hypothetical protein GXP49_06670 [Deltaproteobacteria bacterium]|nr:hypothetical protein [Deltaproteobacteria bacterium]